MGILQLVSPVTMMAYSVTVAGIQTAISNFVASSFRKGKSYLGRRYFLCGLFFSVTLSVLYSLIIYGQAEAVAVFFLKEPRCIPLLKILSFSFPLSSVHSCFCGYYYGKKEAKLPALTQVTEQMVRIFTVLSLYYFFTLKNIPVSILLTCFGSLLGELAASLVTFFSFLKENRAQTPDSCIPCRNRKKQFRQKIQKKKESAYGSEKEAVFFSLLSFSLPLTFQRAMVNILHGIEAVSLPMALRMFGYSREISLSIYGVFTGMAFSLILFPSTFPNSAAVLLLPTVSEARACENYDKIRNTLFATIKASLLLGIFFCGIFYFLAPFCGDLLFGSILAGIFIRSLSFLCPFLYLHTTLSGILNGLNKTMPNLYINVFSLLFRLGVIMILVPVKGIDGYITGLLISEIVSCILCLWCLRKYLFKKIS